MESLFHTKCHKILDKQKEERDVVVHADFFQDLTHSAESIEQKVLKIHMSATSGDQDILKDNGTYYT